MEMKAAPICRRRCPASSALGGALAYSLPADIAQLQAHRHARFMAILRQSAMLRAPGRLLPPTDNAWLIKSRFPCKIGNLDRADAPAQRTALFRCDR